MLKLFIKIIDFLTGDKTTDLYDWADASTNVSCAEKKRFVRDTSYVGSNIRYHPHFKEFQADYLKWEQTNP